MRWWGRIKRKDLPARETMLLLFWVVADTAHIVMIMSSKNALGVICIAISLILVSKNFEFS